MRRAFSWAAGLVSVAALGRFLARRRKARGDRVREAPDPADELRRHLEQARARDDETQSAREPERALTLDERRARVHARAQKAVDAMRQPEV